MTGNSIDAKNKCGGNKGGKEPEEERSQSAKEARFTISERSIGVAMGDAG